MLSGKPAPPLAGVLEWIARRNWAGVAWALGPNANTVLCASHRVNRLPNGLELSCPADAGRLP